MMEQEKDDITISAAQAIVDRWITTIGVRYFSPLTNMAVLTEEVGEVARIMAREYGDQSFKPGENADKLAVFGYGHARNAVFLHQRARRGNRLVGS